MWTEGRQLCFPDCEEVPDAGLGKFPASGFCVNGYPGIGDQDFGKGLKLDGCWLKVLSENPTLEDLHGLRVPVQSVGDP